MKISVSACIMAVLMLFCGCSGGGGGAGGDDPVVAIDGVLQDGLFSGVSYKTSTQSGVTDDFGVFKYRAGEEVSFSVGGAVLGKATGRENITLVGLVPGAVDETDPVVTNVSRFLFSLDSDCDWSNDISISAAIRNEMTGRTVDFSLSDEAFENSLASFFTSAGMLNLFVCGDAALCSVEEARRHLREVLRGVPQYRLTVKAGDHSSVTVDPEQEYYDEGEAVNLAVVPDEGWKFKVWLGDISPYENPASIIMNADRTVIALPETVIPEVFQVPMVLRITETGSGTVTADPSGGTYHADPHGYISKNIVVSLLAKPGPGWIFDHWDDGLEGSDNPETIVIDAYKYVTAVFVPLPANRRTVYVDTEGQGVVRLDPPGGVYYAGTQVQVTALPDSEWMFEQWGGDLSGDDPSVTLSMNSNYTISAHFIEVPGERFTLTAETDRGTVVDFRPPATLSHEGSTVSAQYKPGTVVTVTATTRPGYTFVSWGGDLESSENPQTIEMDSDKYITLTSVETP